MNFDWFTRFLARQVKSPAYERSQVLAWPTRSEAGPAIGEETFWASDVALAAGTLIAKTMAMLTVRVMVARGPDDADGNERLRGHPVEYLLGRSPNSEMSAFKFTESMVLCALFFGNGFGEIVRDGLGKVEAIYIIDPKRVTVCRDPNSGALYYEVDNGSGDKVEIAATDIFHLAGPSFASPVGMSMISYAREILGEHVGLRQFFSSFIRNQAAPSGMVTVKPGLTADGMKRLRGEVEQMYTGARKAGRVMIADETVDFKPIGVTPQDSQFLEQRRFSVESICRIFGVPPQMVGDTSKQTFANFEEAGRNFLTLAILPWVTRFEQEANRKLFARAVGRQRQPFLKLNTSVVVRADLEKRNRSYALGRQWGWLSVNDIRRLEDMEPIGEEGDVYLTPMNMEPTAPPVARKRVVFDRDARGNLIGARTEEEGA